MTRMALWRFVGVGGVGTVLFLSLFGFGFHGAFDFWLGITTVAVVVAMLAVVTDPGYRGRLRRTLRDGLLREVAVGVGSAALLFAIFAVGNQLARAWFPFAADDIEGVYALKQGVPQLRIALLIALLIAPAEELYWRGYLQHHLSRRFGEGLALLGVACLYAGVHLPTGNVMLSLAALVGGLFWGALYAWRGSLAANIASHVAWDLAVFVLWPFTVIPS